MGSGQRLRSTSLIHAGPSPLPCETRRTIEAANAAQIEQPFATNVFGVRSVTRADRAELDAHDLVSARFRASVVSLGVQTSTATEIAAQIVDAATDGTNRLRYPVGGDAKRLVATRTELGPEGFTADMWIRLFET